MHTKFGSPSDLFLMHLSEGRLTAKLIAEVARTSESTAYRIIKGEAELTVEMWRLLVMGLPEEVSRDLRAWATQGTNREMVIKGDRAEIANEAVIDMMTAFAHAARTVKCVFANKRIDNEEERVRYLHAMELMQAELDELKACGAPAPLRMRA